MDLTRLSARFPPHPFSVLLGLSLFATLVGARHGLGTVYDALRDNGLPIGLLPAGVTDFAIDERGRFRVRLDQACNAKFESELHYDRNISGVLSYGRISDLAGVEAQELFLWFPVKSIHVDVPSSGRIYFDVGVVFKQFSLSLFDTPPDCVAVFSPDPQLVSVSKRKNGILRHQVPGVDTGRADV
uniref:Uncharacterized protein n=1 Tax=Kalanchoe fedtschenkoi TaxID=63787 RepID=A0A7N0UHE2_KALFE